MVYSELAAAGLSPFPVSPQKRPLVEWKQYQNTPAPQETLSEWESRFPSSSVGVACGPVSGDLEVIDFDVPGKREGVKGEPPAFAPWETLLREHGHGELLDRLVIVRTPSGGVHVSYRCHEAQEGNQKLARSGKDVLIETRGGGGLIVCPPSPGYEPVQGSYDRLPELTKEERDTLLDAARLLDEEPEPETIGREAHGPAIDGTRPGDDYNDKATWEGLLGPFGWQRSGMSKGDKTLWTRPGKSPREGSSAIADTHLYVYSTNTDLPHEKQLSKFAVYAYLYHGGDFKAAAKKLSLDGYGSRTPRPGIVAAIEGETPQYNPTDVGNSKRFVDLYGDRVRYCYAWRKWLVWEGTHWATDEKGGAHISELCKQMAKQMAKQAETKEERAHALKCESHKAVSNYLEFVKGKVAVDPEELDANPWLLNCRNGTIDLKTGELRPHDRDDLITRVCPVAYDPKAPFDLWESFLVRVLPKRELRLFVYRAMGYSLTGRTDEQCFFFLHGSQGANGKSTFMEVLQHILGGYSKAMQAETLMLGPIGRGSATSDVARLKGARFVSAPETPTKRQLDTQRVKQMTGGDRVVARYLFQEEFEYVPQFKLWVTGNHKPTIRDTDNAIWRRVRLVPFSVVIPEAERDTKLKEKLIEQAPGILAWMVMGCLDWQKQGLNAPQEVLAATNAYRKEQDTLGEFLEDRCLTGDPTLEAPSRKLYEHYKLWAIDSGVPFLQENLFGMQLQERGYEMERRMTGRFRLGIAIKEG